MPTVNWQREPNSGLFWRWAYDPFYGTLIPTAAVSLADVPVMWDDGDVMRYYDYSVTITNEDAETGRNTKC